jgi:hypothetical protein
MVKLGTPGAPAIYFRPDPDLWKKFIHKIREVKKMRNEAAEMERGDIKRFVQEAIRRWMDSI